MQVISLIFKNKEIEVKRLIAALRTNTDQQVIAMIGNVKHVFYILNLDIVVILYIYNFSVCADTIALDENMQEFKTGRLSCCRRHLNFAAR